MNFADGDFFTIFHFLIVSLYFYTVLQSIVDQQRVRVKMKVKVAVILLAVAFLGLF